MSTTLFCTAARAGANPGQDRYRKLGMVCIALPEALSQPPATPQTTIRIMRQSSMTLETAACTEYSASTGHSAGSIALQTHAPLGVPGK